MVKAISKSANQPNDMPLTIYIFVQSFVRLMRNWKLTVKQLMRSGKRGLQLDVVGDCQR